jgi:hypothetical protein
MRATKRVSKTASRIQPIIEQLTENEYARDKLVQGAESVREGARAINDGRQHPKRKWPKRIAVGLAGAAAAGAAMASRGSGGGSQK